MGYRQTLRAFTRERAMKKNIGTLDSFIRLLVGAFLLYVGFFPNPVVTGGISKAVIGLCAFIPLLTGLFRFCPLYLLIDVDTRDGNCKPRP
jgi:hypothetical protein